MEDIGCGDSDNFRPWGITDLFAWKLVPEKLGGGIPYIQKFKDAWVSHNKAHIIKSAAAYNLPPELLAGVCWIEVGGDPSFIDGIAFEVRSFDWSGPQWIDEHMTITNQPAKTSFGPVSMQLRTAAETLGFDPAKMRYSELKKLASCLQRDVYNIQIVARHLRQLVEHDKFQNDLPRLTMDQVKIVGARYNRGVGLSLDSIKKNTSYGSFIVNFWPRFSGLIK